MSEVPNLFAGQPYRCSYDVFMQNHYFYLSPDMLDFISRKMDFLSESDQVKVYNFLLTFFDLEVYDDNF